MLKSVNPATEEMIKEFDEMSDEQVDRALENAAREFEEWRTTGFGGRAMVMNKVAELLEERKEELAKLATAEMGKRLSEAKAEIEKCAWVCRYYAENAATFLRDDDRESEATHSFVRYLPIGSVLAVMPWNFPYWQVFRFAAPTLMAGNVGLLKHASSVSQVALAIEELFIDAGAPQGIFQTLLIGSSKVERVIKDDRIKAVTLTGSGPAGSKVAGQAGALVKPSLLELGGSDAFIVMPSADLDHAVETAVKARMINNGQSCIAAKRFIVHADIYDRFCDAFVDKVGKMKIGDPADVETDMGPLSSASIRDELADQVEAIHKAGAKILVGGGKPDRTGFYFEPTVIADIPRDAPGIHEEFFGPVALLFKADTVEHALEIANDNPFGLGSSVWTHDEVERELFIDRLEAGSTFVNSMVASDPRLPFGGTKESGYGRELSEEGIKAFVNAKTVSIA